ncbi:uncharacterized protein TRUGW13939_10009 [Talaromyces rugulosus]|uniref:Uncharacterized protein n=1 Tax=Talaromyces rugulosus TaxID=121627 RepID=A0A7H8R8V4_TALRU|nr:uncharacterized protein TRUGW13939_10009 [Talaromyces rugulosus]QKX62844.1 hypothetical protein TRUGW13939_10009 [Talaromyces rugulosus]
MAPKLEHVFTMRGYMDAGNTVNLNAIKSGPHRIIVPINGGFVEGSGLKAQVLPGSGDWILTDPATDVSHLDVRIQARTDNGHSLYVHYNGKLKANDKVNKVLSFASDAKSTDYGDQEWFATPIVETSDPNFKWVEESVFVAQGRFVVEESRSAVEYQIYRVVN